MSKMNTSATWHLGEEPSALAYQPHVYICTNGRPDSVRPHLAHFHGNDVFRWKMASHSAPKSACCCTWCAASFYASWAYANLLLTSMPGLFVAFSQLWCLTSLEALKKFPSLGIRKPALKPSIITLHAARNRTATSIITLGTRRCASRFIGPTRQSKVRACLERMRLVASCQGGFAAPDVVHLNIKHGFGWESRSFAFQVLDWHYDHLKRKVG